MLRQLFESERSEPLRAEASVGKNPLNASQQHSLAGLRDAYGTALGEERGWNGTRFASAQSSSSA